MELGIATLKLSIKAAELITVEGNQSLSQLLKGKILDRQKMWQFKVKLS